MLSISDHTRCRPVPQTVHVAIYEHRHGTDVRVFLDAAQAQAWRTRIAREWWHHEFDDDPPPEDEIGAEYFERMLERDEFFSTMTCEIEGSRHEPTDPASPVPGTGHRARRHDMMTVDEIFADDRRNPPSERSLPWEETQGGITVVVEPKPHWAEDMRAFRLDAREYCRYADWRAHGTRSRFYGHIDTSGDDVMMKARAMIAREIADGLWEM